ncbi:MAG TPA: PH domain-containing protein [Candidatus Bathyarchaeia archaeon]|nr:PH domain-containing protein [Candidatus Bathyarchaeia archaeon]
MALFFGIFVVIAAYSPKGAVVSPDGISIVKRWTRPVVVPESQILSLERIDRSVLRRTIRLMGAGGFLGSWGYFSCKKLGTFRAYLTNSESLVLIRTVSEGLFVISPENPADFIACAESFGLCPSRESR